MKNLLWYNWDLFPVLLLDQIFDDSFLGERKMIETILLQMDGCYFVWDAAWGFIATVGWGGEIGCSQCFKVGLWKKGRNEIRE